MQLQPEICYFKHILVIDNLGISSENALSYCWTNSGVVSDLRCHDTQYDITVMTDDKSTLDPVSGKISGILWEFEIRPVLHLGHCIDVYTTVLYLTTL